MKITVTNDFITVTAQSASLQELLDALNGADGDTADAILEAMPEDYEYILGEQDYKVLFAFGSPQLTDCDWKFDYSVSATETKLTVSGYK